MAPGKSFEIICCVQKYHFTDCHSCGLKSSNANNGKACVIDCTTIDELVRIRKRATSSQNVAYTMTYVAVINMAINNINHINHIPINTQ